jgi:hypothetical protein
LGRNPLSYPIDQTRVALKTRVCRLDHTGIFPFDHKLTSIAHPRPRLEKEKQELLLLGFLCRIVSPAAGEDQPKNDKAKAQKKEKLPGELHIFIILDWILFL